VAGIRTRPGNRGPGLIGATGAWEKWSGWQLSKEKSEERGQSKRTRSLGWIGVAERDRD